jgi:hypothetical protein
MVLSPSACSVREHRVVAGTHVNNLVACDLSADLMDYEERARAISRFCTIIAFCQTPVSHAPSESRRQRCRTGNAQLRRVRRNGQVRRDESQWYERPLVKESIVYWFCPSMPPKSEMSIPGANNQQSVPVTNSWLLPNATWCPAPLPVVSLRDDASRVPGSPLIRRRTRLR